MKNLQDISERLDEILTLAQDEHPDLARVYATIDPDGYRSITGYRTVGMNPDDIDVAFNAYTFDGSEWRVEQVEADDGTAT